LLVDEALAQARRLRHAYRGPHIVDVGTGCGAIALAVAMHLPVARLTATDISQDALDLARRNAEKLGLSGRVRFALGDLLSPLAEAANIVVANLPYVPSGEWESLAPEIRRFEPRPALDGGPDGLRLIERLLCQAPAHVRSPGALILEIGHDQGAAVAGLARQSFPNAPIAVKKDLASLDRAVVIET
jgi:release factor glutamine methyltransferase